MNFVGGVGKPWRVGPFVDGASSLGAVRVAGAQLHTTTPAANSPAAARLLRPVRFAMSSPPKQLLSSEANAVPARRPKQRSSAAETKCSLLGNALPPLD